MAPTFEEELIEPQRESPFYDLQLFPYTPSRTPVHKRIKFGPVSFYSVFWPTDVPPKARLLFVHGLYEHSLLYEELLDKLSMNGYECFFYDQRGCGLTSLGKFKGMTNDKHINKDLDNFIEYNLRQTRDQVKLYLVGHSAGGGIILDYLRNGKFKSSIKGAIVTAPLILSDSATKPPIFDHIMKFCNRYSFLRNYKFISKIKKEYLTSNHEYLDFLVSDELAIPLVSISQLVDMFEKGKSLIKEEYAVSDTTSLLIIHSPDDKVNSFEGSRLFFSQLPRSQTSIRRLVESKGAHSLFVESDEIRNEIYSLLLEFLEQDLKSSGTT